MQIIRFEAQSFKAQTRITGLRVKRSKTKTKTLDSKIFC